MMASSERDEESLRLLQNLANRDEAARTASFDAIQQTINSWISAFESSSELNGHPSGPTVNGKFARLQNMLPDLLRLKYCCPFKDVRDNCTLLLQDIRARVTTLKIPRRVFHGPCQYITEKEVIAPDTTIPETQIVFIDAFLQNNRLDHVSQVMGFHPQYLECFLKTQQFLLRGDGPLPYHYRHYIAIMAAGRHQCSYLINLHIQEYILQGGDPNWLKGLEHIPQKLRDLYNLNKMLAHQPWMITKLHIEKLTKGMDNWSVSELVHALVLLAHFHALASFVYGCGISPELDHEGGFTYRRVSDANCNTESDSSSSDVEDDLGVAVLVERMQKLNEEDGEMTQEESLKQFENVESQSAELTTNSHIPSPREDVLKFVDSPDFSYFDFAKREEIGTKVPTFRAQDYTWEDHGFSLANRYYSDVGTLLDDKFTIAYNLTYYTLGDRRNVDTTAFRRAVWNYIHSLYGIRHDDYNYGEVNQMLEKNLKCYIKTVTCFPERLTKKKYDSVMREFKHSEKVHVNLMLLEARLQAELLYSLRAIMQHMT